MGVTFQGLIAPVQLIIITGLLWKEVGAFALIPAGVFVVSIPIIILLNLDYANIVEATKVAADARLKLVREFISAIRIVKYYAWEKAFQRNIGNFREDEVNKVKKTSFIRVAGVSLFAAVPPIATGSSSDFPPNSASLSLTAFSYFCLRLLKAWCFACLLSIMCCKSTMSSRLLLYSTSFVFLYYSCRSLWCSVANTVLHSRVFGSLH
jgi:hypothetical protein